MSVETFDVVNNTNSPCEFTIDIPGVDLPDDLSKLKATLKRPGSRREESVTLKLLSDNTLSLSFVPKSPGDYQVNILKRHRPVPGGPFSITVTEEKPENPLGKPVSVALVDIPLRDLPRIQVFIQRPGSDTEEPITLKQNSDDSLSVSFIPREPGAHIIHVRKNSKPLPGSPYEIEIIDDRVFDRVFDTPEKVPYDKEPSDKIPYREMVGPGKGPQPEKIPSPKKSPVHEESPPPDKDTPSEERPRPVQEVHPAGKPCDVGIDVPGVNSPDDVKKLTVTVQRPGSDKEEPVKPEIKPDGTVGKSESVFTPMFMPCSSSFFLFLFILVLASRFGLFCVKTFFVKMPENGSPSC